MEAEEERAIAVLREYFTPLSGNVGFTGGAFGTFDPSGTRASLADTFTAEDLVPVTLLSVQVPGSASVEILDRQRHQYATLLEEIGPDRDLVDVESTAPGFPHGGYGRR